MGVVMTHASSVLEALQRGEFALGDDADVGEQ
jgi:hypothetical protein